MPVTCPDTAKARQVLSFVVFHRRPCPDPGCSVTAGMALVCMDIEHSGLVRGHAHLEPGTSCAELAACARKKVAALAGVRFHAGVN